MPAPATASLACPRAGSLPSDPGWATLSAGGWSGPERADRAPAPAAMTVSAMTATTPARIRRVFDGLASSRASASQSGTSSGTGSPGPAGSAPAPAAGSALRGAVVVPSSGPAPVASSLVWSS